MAVYSRVGGGGGVAALVAAVVGYPLMRVSEAAAVITSFALLMVIQCNQHCVGAKCIGCFSHGICRCVPGKSNKTGHTFFFGFFNDIKNTARFADLLNLFKRLEVMNL